MRNTRRLTPLVCALVLLEMGCSLIPGALGSEKAKSHAPMTCPDTIAAEPSLEADYGATLRARAWISGLRPDQLGFRAGDGMNVHEVFQSELKLADGPVRVLGLTHQLGAGLVLLRPQGDGFCVVNHWATWQSANADHKLEASWTASNQRMSILLLKLVVGPGTAEAQTRWIVIGTDGRRAWFALGEPPQNQLLAPAVTLRPVGKQLYLQVTQRRISRFLLGKDGRFIIPK